MKRIAACLLLICFLCACAHQPGDGVTRPAADGASTTAADFEKPSQGGEMLAVWISCYELPDATAGEESFYSEISKMFENVSELGFNTVFVHVRAFADAVYPSEFFPWSKYCCSGRSPGFDPLAVMVRCAKERSLSIHAWINPFRISLSNDTSTLPEDSPAHGLLQEEGAVAVLENGIYFNPASTQIHLLIYSGVREILENYEVDGIHIDDYFYPAARESIDSVQYSAYKKSGGVQSLESWRSDSVSAFAAGLYSLVKSYGGEKIFSISPAGNIEGNEKRLFADVRLWLSEPGYADIIIPQLYFGFENAVLPFESTALMWSAAASCSEVKIVWGLAPYKCGKEDKNAGEGSDEWIENSDIISRQVELVRQLTRYDGVALFSYSYIFLQKSNQNLKKEMQSLRNLL